MMPYVVLMDVVMPDMDGATATAHIREACPDIRVIALTSFVEDELVERTLDAGQISYLLKDSHPERLTQAIRDAFHGRGTIDGGALQALRQRDAVGRDLTLREREVLKLLAAGLSNNGIGAVAVPELGDGEAARQQHPREAGGAEPDQRGDHRHEERPGLTIPAPIASVEVKTR